MAGRMTLLILMTGLFAAAWSSDRDPNSPTETAVRTRRTPLVSGIRETTLHRWKLASDRPAASAATAWTPTRDVQPPRHIAPGTYLVVNPDGHTRRVVIAETQARQHRTQADHFVSEQNGQRQHWIRMDDASHPEIGHETVVVVLMNRAGIPEIPTVQRTGRTMSIPAGSSLQEILSQLVEAITTPRNDAPGSMAAEDAESVNR